MTAIKPVENIADISVSEVPVDIFEVTAETEKILTSLPLQIRQPEIYATDLSSMNHPVIKQQQDPSDNIKLVRIIWFKCWLFYSTCFVWQDSGISEELSVKTLANMFDFKLSDPSMCKNLHKLIRESKLDANTAPIDVNTCSECWFLFRNKTMKYGFYKFITDVYIQCISCTVHIAQWSTSNVKVIITIFQYLYFAGGAPGKCLLVVQDQHVSAANLLQDRLVANTSKNNQG